MGFVNPKITIPFLSSNVSLRNFVKCFHIVFSFLKLLLGKVWNMLLVSYRTNLYWTQILHRPSFMKKDKSTVAPNGSEEHDLLYSFPLFSLATYKDPKLTWRSPKYHLKISQLPNWKMFYNSLAYDQRGAKRKRDRERGGGRGKKKEEKKKEGRRTEGRLAFYSCLLTYSAAHAEFWTSASSLATSFILQILHSVIP